MEEKKLKGIGPGLGSRMRFALTWPLSQFQSIPSKTICDDNRCRIKICGPSLLHSLLPSMPISLQNSKRPNVGLWIVF